MLLRSIAVASVITILTAAIFTIAIDIFIILNASICTRMCNHIITSAAAPSEIELDVAAVTVPSAPNAGFSVGIFSGFARLGLSSSVTVPGPYARRVDLFASEGETYTPPDPNRPILLLFGSADV